MVPHRLAMSFGLAVVFVSAIDSSTAQQQLAVSRGNTVTIVDAGTQQTVRTIKGQNVGKLAYQPDGERLGPK